jgi:transcriptional regulator with XRE-family HTH domain
MLLSLKVTMLQRGIKQYRMAVDLGWDPAKLSRIVNEIAPPTADDRKAIAEYLGMNEADLFTEKPSAPRLPRRYANEPIRGLTASR